eukprot:gene9381-10361_t
MASALIHLANKDYYTSLVDDFIALDVLPMERARSQRGRSSDGQSAHSLCRGGGAKEYEKELRRIYGLDQLGLYAWWFPMTEYDDNSKYFKLLQEFGKGYRFTKNGSGCDIRNRSLVNLYPLPNSCNSLKYRRTHQSETLQHRTSVPPQQRRQFSKTKRSNDF